MDPGSEAGEHHYFTEDPTERSRRVLDPPNKKASHLRRYLRNPFTKLR